MSQTCQKRKKDVRAPSRRCIVLGVTQDEGALDHAITEPTPPSFEKIFRPRTFGGKVALRVKALRKNILHTKGIKVEADGKGDFIYLVRLLFLSLDSHHQHLGGLPLQTVPQTDNESK